MSARQRRLTVASSALLILSIAVAAWAYFSAVGTGAGDASTTTIANPVVTASSPSNGDAHISWTAVNSPANTPSENTEVTYVVQRSTSASGPWLATTPTCAGTLPSATHSCDDFPTTGGTYYYRVTASFRSWTSSGVSNSVVIVTDNAAPTASITFPADATTYKASTYNAGCTPTGICGSAADATGVASVRLSIKRNSDNTYWNGSIFTGTTETFNPATALGNSGGTSTTWRYTFALPADGGYTIHVQAADTLGNAQTGSTYATTSIFTIDTTAPVTTIAVSPASPNGSNGWYKTTAPTFTLSATDTGGSGVASTFYKIDAGSAQTYSGAVTIPEGQHTISYWSTDTVGNTETTHTTATIKVDTVNPITTIAISPSSPNGSNGWYKTTAPTFTLSGTDTSGSGVATTSYQIDAGATQTYSSAVTIPDGQHTITYWSTDSAGNIETSHTTATIKVDTVNPSNSLSLASSPVGAYLSGATLYYKSDVAGSFKLVNGVTDATSGQASATFPSLTGTNWTTHSAETVSTPAIGPYTSSMYQWSASAGAPSTSAFTATDTAGNTNPGTTLTFTSDTTAPTGTITSPVAGNVSGSVSLQSTTAADTQSGVASVAYYYCSGSCATTPPSAGWTLITTSTTGPNWTGSWDISSLANGPYTLKAVITDNVGNQAVTAGVSVTNVSYTFSIGTIATRTAGAAFGGFTVQLQKNGSNIGTYLGSSYAGNHTIALSGSAWVNAPDGTQPTPLAGTLTLNFNASGQATVVGTPITLFKAATGVNLVLSDATNSIAGTSSNFDVNAGSRVGIVWTAVSITTPSTTYTCSGSVGSLTCSGTYVLNNGPQFSGKVALADAYQNQITNTTGSAITIDIASSGNFGSGGNPNPSGSNALSIANNSAASGALTFVVANGSGKTATVTATVHGTSQTLNMTLHN